ncbi:polysaccharide lyase 6 family protein [Novosphingobium barchaimii]|uniref:polysaccharide lyase 6 family protein n=1 Tax=Novosphingobium barchaimii TaxID=1420591 RepID=UPI001F2BF6AF|nr:polysaccharide lyase 6 family protein [Novosphingobium barchaimii]
MLAAEFLVHDQAEYRAAIVKAAPGDIVRLADGEWKDFPLLFEGKGTEKRPITLTAQTKGKVVLSGTSSLKLAGSYLVVSGLVFRGGHAPGAEVISFRRDSQNVAAHSRLTEIVIDHFNQPDRRKEDRWVSLYGHDNRVDHSWFAGKGNAGVTLAVIRPKGQAGANNHRIDHNYFGPRPPLGSNGGETIRIGTSEESLSDSASMVDSNVFDRCDGEVEIVSVKSGGNIIRGNLILRSQGSIVLRHGNGNLVERNVFMGHGKPHTGGVRVINMRQTVRDNYMEGLAGTDFTSALAVMNGVPGSAINRYHPVSQAVIAGNSILNAGRITLGAGADAERTAAPSHSELRGNLMTGANADTLFQIEADTRGIVFSRNVTSAAVPAPLSPGVRQIATALARAGNGLLYPADPQLAQVGAPRDLKPLALKDVGPDWYAKPADQTGFGTGRSVTVSADGLATATAQATPGEVLRLKAGRYTVNAPLNITAALTITGPAAAEIVFSSPTLFALAEGGSLRLEGLTIRGDKAPRLPGNAAVRAAQVSTIANYAVEMDGTVFTGMDAAPDFDLIATAPATFADHIDLNGISVTGLSGKVLAASAETSGRGLYAAEHIRIINSRFERIGALADILRGGTDESTFGPEVTITGNTVAQSGRVLLTLSGVQSTLIEDNTFRRGGAITLAHSVGSPDTRIRGNRLVETPEPLIKKLYPQGTPKVQVSDNTRSGDAS